MGDVRQSPEWARFMVSLGWEAGKLSSGYVYSKRLPLIGSILKIPKIGPDIDFAHLEKLSKEKRVLFTKIEPDVLDTDSAVKRALEKNGFQSDRWSLQPTKTLVVGLTPSQEEILARMEKDTRYSIRAAAKRGVKVEKTNDLEIFWRLYSETSKRGSFWITRKEAETLWKVFNETGKAALLIAYYDNEPLAASFLLFHEKTAYYYHAASSGKRRDLFATYYVVWQSLLEAKKRGCTRFDLMGIADSRIPSTRSWGGFTHFKRGFGGEEVTYLGSFIKVYNPILKPIFWLNKLF
ncbi:MAG: hypothetical protein A3F35_01900 [Candidatus Woykebacteria bacterium RIFCSPHIGHO2_12_FULL_45_10]|uniref:BioF2-like acetyltransferase domain-containing protein n=1 Tax=Candidatus Woykebacteria bacterium RIFCSPHIGHO2_12_FULL_45_10 TaxID=1802603 RepID=A0A1G1WRQ9_9BACT|nr:MAG: hypothetical protein A3F35_01900 [Candidatus Woykebacteria bacterium RIFCSPHIGHO2_12_FULL_45_10]